ncbi:hypothetical protein DFH29DRAFT_590598 [Suillus ampliporus]|nr:hypothetical protein DFH29DRAFT_590598 [Suillus ampliporus]
MNELHNMRTFYPSVIPPYLSLKDKERFNILSQELPPVDVERWNSLAELHMRRRLFQCQCDACHYLVSDVLHRCIDCECDEYDVCVECESLPVSDHKYPSDHKPTHNMLVFRMSLPYGRYRRVRWYARKFLSAVLSACVPATAAPQEGSLNMQEEESQTQSDGPEIPDSTEAPKAQVDASSASLAFLGDDEKLSGTSGEASRGTTETSVAKRNAYICAECGVKLKGILYVCLTCGELLTAIALCGDCAFRDEFNVVTAHHPYKHWLVKIKDRVQDENGTPDEPVDNSNETTLASLSSRVDNLAAIVESRFAELDLRLSERFTQIDQLVHSLTELMGKAQLPSETAHSLVDS